MELILNVNKLGYKPFLKTKINAFSIGYQSYCDGEEYFLDYKNLIKAINTIKEHNKKIYLNLNILLSETRLEEFKDELAKLLKLQVDGFIVGDLGVLNIFKKLNVIDKVIFNPHTYICNNLSAKFFIDLGVSRICLSNELNKEEVFEITNYLGGKVEILAEGLPKMSISKRKLISIYFDHYNLNKKSEIYYLKEEKRQELIPIREDEQGIYVYDSKSISVFNNLDKYLNNKIEFYRIDGFLKSKEEIIDLIDLYYKRSEKICKK